MGLILETRSSTPFLGSVAYRKAGACHTEGLDTTLCVVFSSNGGRGLFRSWEAMQPRCSVEGAGSEPSFVHMMIIQIESSTDVRPRQKRATI